MTLERAKTGTHCHRIAVRHVLHRSNLGYMPGVPIDAIVDIDDDELFSTPAVCRMAGVTFRQVDHWARCEVIVPATPARGSGTQRRYTGAQVRDIAMAGRLRELGVSLDAIEEIFVALRDAEGALLVIGTEFVRAVEAHEVADAINDAHGAAIVVNPDTLRILSETAPRRSPRHRRFVHAPGTPAARRRL